MVLADNGGVVFIPSEHEDAVLETAELIARTEKAMAQRIDAGWSVSSVMGRDYEELTKQ
jgi:regulator of RNase E activity RraA